jgi:hypothetical protein
VDLVREWMDRGPAAMRSAFGEEVLRECIYRWVADEEAPLDSNEGVQLSPTEAAMKLDFANITRIRAQKKKNSTYYSETYVRRLPNLPSTTLFWEKMTEREPMIQGGYPLWDPFKARASRRSEWTSYTGKA